MTSETTKVLDDGFVRLVDTMGDDAAIVQAARVSYGVGTKTPSDDATLIRYLMRHRHTTPFEMCLAGDVRIPTFPCRGASVKTYTMRELAEAFAEGGRKNSWAKLLRIRTVNVDTFVVAATRIKRVWCTGVRDVYEITTEAPFIRRIRLTGDHPILTPGGFASLDDGLEVGDTVMHNGVPALEKDVINEIIRRRQQGQSITDVASALGVSKSVVYKYSPGRSQRKTGYLNKPIGTHDDPRVIARRTVTLGRCQIRDCGSPAEHRHHIDENPHNNDPANLACLCASHHKHAHTMSRLEVAVPARIASIKYLGEQEVFDLEVEDDNHTFVAEGIVVHNCEAKFHVRVPMDTWRQWIRHRTASVNEYSTRFSEAIDSMAVTSPDAWRPQSITNKQGSAQGTIGSEVGTALSGGEIALHEHAKRVYRARLDAGVAREQARKDLPLSTYTEAYWKMDLHNLLHFLELRLHPHAQLEIRAYADAIARLVRDWVPMTWAAFVEYRLCGVHLSKTEKEIIVALINGYKGQADVLMGSLSPRERREFMEKMK